MWSRGQISNFEFCCTTQKWRYKYNPQTKIGNVFSEDWCIRWYHFGVSNLARRFCYLRPLLPFFSRQNHMCINQAIKTGRVRQSAVIYCQIRLVYSKSGVIAFVRFTRATNWSADNKGDQLYTLACLVNVCLWYNAGDLLHFIFRDGYVENVLGEDRFAHSVCMAKLVWFFKNKSPIRIQRDKG